MLSASSDPAELYYTGSGRKQESVYGNSLDVPIGWLYTGNSRLGIPSLGPGPFFAVLAAIMVVLVVGMIPIARKFNRSQPGAG